MRSNRVRLVTRGGTPVRVVTSAPSDPVEFVTQGPSDPVRIVTTGVSDPVRVIGSIPGSDIIGDGLRADAIAYWKMDEASGTRVDSTGHGYDLVDANDPTPSDTGKIGDALKSQDDPILYHELDASLSPSVDVSAGVTVAAWIKANQAQFFGVQNTVTGMIVLQPPELPPLQIGPKADFQMRVFCDSFGDSGFDAITQDISVDTWHWVVVWYDPVANVGYLQLDNGVIVSHVPWMGMSATLSIVVVGANNGANTNDTVWFDEVGIWARVLTSDERDYLYNSGAGRTLYP